MQFMWNSRAILRIDFRILPLVVCLMGISLLVISSMTANLEGERFIFWTPLVKTQVRWCCLGWAVFFLAAGFDYRKLRDWGVVLYLAIVVLLMGLFFVSPIQNVHRWYRIAGLISFQPSEQAKLILVVFLGWFLEKKGTCVDSLQTALQMGILVGVPFLLILKQPDLGTALILYPIALVMGYFGGIHRSVMKVLIGCGMAVLFLVMLMFMGILSHEQMRPAFTSVIKPYQYERLNPDTYHQKAAQTAIAIGGLTGTGWHKSEFSGKKWLPAAHTDSVFAAFGEEFGFVGIAFLLFLFYALIYFSFQVAAVARDPFGRFLAAGLAMYLAMHVMVNIGMMCALLPISGVPLIFVTYGGSSLLTTMATLGVLQSIYSRRFMF
jgi:rod shape determining protein RodA